MFWLYSVAEDMHSLETIPWISNFDLYSVDNVVLSSLMTLDSGGELHFPVTHLITGVLSQYAHSHSVFHVLYSTQ